MLFRSIAAQVATAVPLCQHDASHGLPSPRNTESAAASADELTCSCHLGQAGHKCVALFGVAQGEMLTKFICRERDLALGQHFQQGVGIRNGMTIARSVTSVPLLAGRLSWLAQGAAMRCFGSFV